MSEEKILTNAPGMDYFYVNTFATSPQMEAFLFFMASVVFVKHRMTFLSSHFSLYCSRLATHLQTVLFSTNYKKN